METRTVSRNNVTKPLVPKKIAKGDYKGIPYLGLPEITNQEELDEAIKFFGIDYVRKVLNNVSNQFCIQSMRNNILEKAAPDEDGVEVPTKVNWDAVATDIEELSVAAETLSELKDRKIEVLTEMKDLFPIVFGSDTTAAAQAKITATNLGEEVKRLDEAIEAREAEFARRQEKKKLTEAAKAPVASA